MTCIPPRIIRSTSRELLRELESSRLEVCKVRTDRDSWIRCPITQNPPWYQDFCAGYTRTRRRYPKVRTFIKRCLTLNALRKISRGATEGIYVERLLAVIAAEASSRGHWKGRATA